MLSGKLAFASGRYNDYDIFLLDLDLNKLIQLTATPMLDKATPGAVDALVEKIGRDSLDRNYFATERYID